MKLLVYGLLVSLFIVPVNAVTHTEEQKNYLEERHAEVLPYFIHWTEEQNKLVHYAWKLSQNFDFILTIRAESGFRPDAVWDWGTSYWLCQRHVPWDIWRREYSTDPALENWYTMIDKCRESRNIKWDKIGGWLYGYNVRNRYKKEFIWK